MTVNYSLFFAGRNILVLRFIKNTNNKENQIFDHICIAIAIFSFEIHAYLILFSYHCEHDVPTLRGGSHVMLQNRCYKYGVFFMTNFYGCALQEIGKRTG